MARTQVTSAMMKAPGAGTQTYGASTSVLRSITTDESGRVVNSTSTNSLTPGLTFNIQENFITQAPPFAGNVKRAFSGNAGFQTQVTSATLDNDLYNSGSYVLFVGTTAAGTAGPQQGAGLGSDGGPSITLLDNLVVNFSSFVNNLSTSLFDSTTKKGFGRFGLMQARNGANYTVLPDSLITTSGYEPKNGVYFRVKNSSVLECVTRNTDIETVTVTNVSLTQDTWRRLSFTFYLVSNTENVQFFIDGVTVATHLTNITKKPLGIGMHIYRDFGTNQTSANEIVLLVRNYFVQLYSRNPLF